MDYSNFSEVPTVWTPDGKSGERMRKFITHIKEKYEIKCDNYWDLHKWSVDHPDKFWSEMWDISNIIHSRKYDKVIDLEVPLHECSDWFPGARVNFAENLLRFRDDKIALIQSGENSPVEKITFRQMYEEVKLYAAAFRKCDLKKGDVVVCQMSNRTEAVYAMLAATSIGAIWTGALPHIGAQAVLSRFQQVNPKMFLTIDRIPDNKKHIEMLEKVQEIVEGLPSLQKVIIVPSEKNPHPIDISGIRSSCLLKDFLQSGQEADGSVPEIQFEQVSFSHPIFISYTSGTTGPPKSIVHGSGLLLSTYRDFYLQSSMNRDCVWLSTSPVGWATWNAFSCLLGIGVTLACYEGTPYFLSPTYFWDLVEELKVSHLFLPASVLDELEKLNYVPKEQHTLKHLQRVSSGGSVVKLKSYDFVYQKIKKDIMFSSIYGVTEFIGVAMFYDLTLPVHKGELPVPVLGIDFTTVDDSGKQIKDGQIGDFVTSAPNPSLPLGLWNDPNKEIYQEKYFSKYPGKFYIGDYGYINPVTNGIVVRGRSDETIKQRGWRFGSAEIYNIVDKFPEVRDSICASFFHKDMSESAVLFIKKRDGHNFNEAFVKRIRQTITTELTEHHVPDYILETKDIPYNINGKKMEIIVKKIMNKMPYNADTIINPDSLEYYKNIPELQTP